MASQGGIAHEKGSSIEQVETFPDNVDPELRLRHKEKALIRKLDSRIVPVMTLTYLMSYMDRGELSSQLIPRMCVLIFPKSISEMLDSTDWKRTWVLSATNTNSLSRSCL